MKLNNRRLCYVCGLLLLPFSHPFSHSGTDFVFLLFESDVWAFVFHPSPLKLSILLSLLLSPPSSLHLHYSLHLPLFFHASQPSYQNLFYFVCCFLSFLSCAPYRFPFLYFISLPRILIPVMFLFALIIIFRPSSITHTTS